ncbi:hypothetical protein [Chloroflexus sp.]|uniref:hypothetical protein n=1 Tax=Chloroflexus sp. TaxID=1904827 RepID=UPI002ACEA6DB|nr:hypothetical protein [Chloroflexus sp.]
MPHSFINVIAQEWRALRAPALWIALAGFLAATLLSAQLPRQYVIDVGYEEGVGNVDLPFLRDFYPAEAGVNGTFRWTGGNAKINLLGLAWALALPSSNSVGCRLVMQLPISRRLPIQVWSHDQLIAEVPVRRTTSRQWLLMPSAADGHLRIRLVSDSFQIPPDPRRLSLPLERIKIAVIPGGWAWPAVDRLLWWTGASCSAG